MVKTTGNDWNTGDEKKKVLIFLVELATDPALMKKYELEKNRREILVSYNIHENYIDVILSGDMDELWRLLGQGERIIVQKP